MMIAWWVVVIVLILVTVIEWWAVVMAWSRLVEMVDGEAASLMYDLIIDSSGCRKRLNDYTEGLLVQTAQKLDLFKAAYEERLG